MKGLEKWKVVLECPECAEHIGIFNADEKELKWIIKQLKPVIEKATHTERERERE